MAAPTLLVPIAPNAIQTESPSGLWAVLRLRWTAWNTEQITEAELRILACRQCRVEAQAALTAAEQGAQIRALAAALCRQELETTLIRRAVEATVRFEEAEEEQRLRASVRDAAPDAARQTLVLALERERLLLARERLRRQRLTGLPESVSERPVPPRLPAVPQPSPPPILEVYISDQQVEALAVKAVAQFGHLATEEAERAWAGWQQELHYLPPYVAQEVLRRATQLRGLAR